MEARTLIGVGAMIAVAGLLLGAAGNRPADPTTWEYGVFEVLGAVDDPNPTYRWVEQGRTVSAQGQKFRLFTKLGAQRTLTNYHDIVLWNHLARDGWEFVEQFQTVIGGETTAVKTIFRRRAN